MKKDSSTSSYRSILKGTSIFGGVQIFNILINLVRGKFVAVILGPEGMGISSLFMSVSNTIRNFASLGLNQAIVRETAASSSDSESNSRVIHTVRILTNLTALIGLLVCMVFCIPLSRLTFGSEQYAWQFVLLGAAVGFFIAGNAKLAVLQGLHEVKRISKASIVGGLTGLFVGVPLYYIFGDKGIVPAIVALSLSLYIFYSVNLHRCNPASPSSGFSWKENKETIKKLIFLGAVLMASDLIGSTVTYVLNLFIRTQGSLDDVGLYQAANSVTNQYAGLVFAAMAMDYYPRLSKVSHDNSAMCEVVNRQTEIVSLLIAPAMCALIISAPLVIRVLLSDSFLDIIPLMRWMGLGILIKALSFPMGYIAFAKGNRKVFFILEGLTGNLLYLILGCLGFYFFGLIGIGYALVAENFISIVIYYFVNRRLYDYNFTFGSFNYLLVATILGILCFGSSLMESTALSYTFMGIVTGGAVVWALVSLRAKLNRDATGSPS